MTRLGAATVGTLLAVVVCGIVPGVARLPAGLDGPLVLIGVALSIAVVVSLGPPALAHAKLARKLNAASTAVLGSVHVRELPGIEGAFVAGLIRPTIYCSPTLSRRLTPDEVHAVLWHERYHQRTRAPATLVILEALSTILAPESRRRWMERWIAALEIAADRDAIACGAPRSALAGALLKLTCGGPAARIGFTSAAELRLLALLEPARQPARMLSASWLAAVGTVASLCVLLRMP